MSKETFIKGFCKAAAAAGIDPAQLAKYAAETQAPKVGTTTVSNEITIPVKGTIPRLLGMNYHWSDHYEVPVDEKGGTEWLGSTEPVVHDGYLLPGGTAGITNAPSAAVWKIKDLDGPGQVVWNGVRDRLKGVGRWKPSNPEIAKLLQSLAKSKSQSSAK